jgi:hypothetical protein
LVKDFFGEEEKSIIDWTPIDQYLKEGTKSGLSMALVECDKLLNHLLHLKGYKGKNVYQRIASAKDAINDLGGLAYALEIKENLLHEFDKEVSEKELRRAIEKFRETIIDIERSQIPEAGLVDLAKRNLDYYFIGKPDRFRRFVLWFLAIIIGVIVLDNTHIGQAIVHFVAGLFGGAISWLFVLGILAGIVMLLSLIILAIGKKRK